MIRALILIVGLLFLFSGYGCAPAGVIASGGATTMVIAEGDRSLGTVVDDATIKLNIAGKFLSSENKKSIPVIIINILTIFKFLTMLYSIIIKYSILFYIIIGSFYQLYHIISFLLIITF